MSRVAIASNVILVLSSFPCVAGAQVSHLEQALGWSHQPITNAAIDGRLAQAAVDYHAYAPIPRIAMYDIAYPKDSAEAVALGANAVLVVTAVVGDSTELPLRVYLSTASGARDLVRFAQEASYVADTTIRATFGRHRVDALYLLPLSGRAAPGELLVDFAVHRRGFRLAQFAGDVPGPLQQLGRIPGASGPPVPTALWGFVRREYPDLSTALAPR